MKKVKLLLDLEPEVRIFLKKENKIVMGRGTYLLLKEIQKHGNIMDACRALGMSYKKAMKLIKRVEDLINEEIIESKRGGAAHGFSKLTDVGLLLIKIYEKVENIIENSLKELELSQDTSTNN